MLVLVLEAKEKTGRDGTERNGGANQKTKSVLFSRATFCNWLRRDCSCLRYDTVL